MLYRIERDWYRLMVLIESGTAAEQNAARKQLADSLASVDPIFANRKYFMGDEFTLVDCMMAPLLWRLKYLGVVLTPQAKNLERYCKRLFARDSVQISFSDVERELEQDLAETA
jgi:RNA polymerase-associated protein